MIISAECADRPNDQYENYNADDTSGYDQISFFHYFPPMFDIIPYYDSPIN